MWLLLIIEAGLFVLAAVGTKLRNEAMTIIAVGFIFLFPAFAIGGYAGGAVLYYMKPMIPNIVFGSDRVARENISIVSHVSYGKHDQYTFSNGQKAPTPLTVSMCGFLGFVCGAMPAGIFLKRFVFGIAREYFPATYKLIEAKEKEKPSETQGSDGKA